MDGTWEGAQGQLGEKNEITQSAYVYWLTFSVVFLAACPPPPPAAPVTNKSAAAQKRKEGELGEGFLRVKARGGAKPRTDDGRMS